MLIHAYRPAVFIKVTGEDVATFLQGQFTNELRQPAGTAVYGLWLNQKGRVLADSHVLKLAENEFQVVSDTSAASTLLPRLEKYIVADDVILADETAQIHGLAVSGPQCADGIWQILGATPVPGRFLRSRGLVIFAGRRVRGENYELLGSPESIADMRQKLLALDGREIAAAEAEYLRIADGLPAVPQDIGPGDLPNEGGLDEAAISFTKGCYLGQEVMARLKSMGQVRRRLHLIRGEGMAPGPMAALYQGGKTVGQVRSVASRGNGFVALAMLSLVNLDPAAGLGLAVGAASGATIIFPGGAGATDQVVRPARGQPGPS